MMPPPSDHISDRELLLDLDGELNSERAEAVHDHLDHCELCHDRQADLAIASQEFEASYWKLGIPDARKSRAALLKTLEQDRSHSARQNVLWKTAAGFAAVVAIAIAWRVGSSPSSRTLEPGFAPVPSLTPGFTRPISREALCSNDAEQPELQRVANDLAQQVFHRYGIESPRPRTYEIDYLIPPELGGAEDARNLWPQPYARGVWNARVKDALEDRLRALVCDGKIDLATAQHELARDWIGAYKRYFRTDKPLVAHVAFSKDQPWE